MSERIPPALMSHVDFACQMILDRGLTREQVKERWPSLYGMIMQAGEQETADDRIRQHERAERGVE